MAKREATEDSQSDAKKTTAAAAGTKTAARAQQTLDELLSAALMHTATRVAVVDKHEVKTHKVDAVSYEAFDDGNNENIHYDPVTVGLMTKQRKWVPNALCGPYKTDPLAVALADACFAFCEPSAAAAALVEKAFDTLVEVYTAKYECTPAVACKAVSNILIGLLHHNSRLYIRDDDEDEADGDGDDDAPEDAYCTPSVMAVMHYTSHPVWSKAVLRTLGLPHSGEIMSARAQWTPLCASRLTQLRVDTTLVNTTLARMNRDAW